MPTDLHADSGPLSGPGRTIALANYDHIEQQASLAASKAIMLVTALSILIATYTSLSKDCLVFTSLGFSPPGVLYFLGGAGILAGFAFALAAVFPRVTSHRDGDVLFYASVAETWSSFDQYRDAYLHRLQSGNLDIDILRNIYGKSYWLRRNFRWIKLSILATAIGTGLTVASLFLLNGVNQIDCSRFSTIQILANAAS